MCFFRALLLIAGLLGYVRQASSQKQIEIRDQTWIGYFNQIRFTDKSGLWVDVHYRLNDDFIKEKTFSLARVAYIYHVSNNIRLMAGYAYATRYSNVGVTSIPEHRPWQQIQWVETKKRFILTQNFRIEQRFRRNVAEGELTDYDFNWRFRSNFAFTIPLSNKGLQPRSSFLLFSSEININAGKSIVHNYFDQYRLFMGAGYQFTENLNAHLGYLFIYQQEPAADRYLLTNVIRLFVIHSLDFRKRE